MLSLTQLKEVLIKNNGKHAIYVQGPPGCGKSQTIAQIAEELEMDYFADIRLGTRDPQDLKGILIPDLANHITIATRPDYFPDEELGEDITGILFLDEFDHAAPSTQSAAYQLILDRKIGNYKLPEGIWIILASNAKEDGGVHFQIKRPVKNRMIQLKAKATTDEWLERAINIVGLNPLITAFIKQNPHMLYHTTDINSKLELEDDMGGFATPRSWYVVHDILEDDYEPYVLSEMLKGAIGNSAAKKFLDFISIVDNSIDPEKILEDDLGDLNTNDLKNTTAIYYTMSYFETHIRAGTISSKSTLTGLLRFISMIPDLSLRMVYFDTILNASKRVLTPTLKEKEALELRKAILESFNRPLN